MSFLKFNSAVRNASRNIILTFAKIFGLSLSFAVILFAMNYVYYETSFDKCIQAHDRIYRCLGQGQLDKEKVDFALTSPAQAPAIVNDIPEITQAIRLNYRGRASLKCENKSFDGGQLYYADTEFFSFFGIPIKTNLGNPLAAKNYLTIAKSVAEKHFGSVENALGKEVDLNGEKCLITGTFEDLPHNFHLRINMIQTLEKTNPDQVGWGSQSYYTYFKTSRPNIDINELNFKISKSVYSHYDDRIDGAKAKTMADLKYAENFYVFYTCEPLKDIHFSTHKFDPAVTANKTYVYGAVILAILVLLISSINFVNLTIASISTRLKEVGIRKCIGAYKKNIAAQFLYETFIFFIVSFTLAGVICLLAGKPLGQYLGFDLTLTDRLAFKITAVVFAALLIFNLAVNALPIILASNKKILNLVKNDNVIKTHNWNNHSLVLIQFVLSGIIILSSVIVHKQINFMAHKNLGYDVDNVMMFNMWEMNPQVRKSFIQKLKTYRSVKSVATSDAYFGEDFGMNSAYFETKEDQNYFHTSVLPVDDQFLNTFSFKLKEGRFFDYTRKADYNAIVLNETAAKEYSGNGTLVGKNVIVGNDNKTYHVIGIVEDFNFRSLHHKIEPLIITPIENFGNIYIKINNAQTPEVIGIIQNLWKEFNIDFPLDYTFHDEVLARHYMNDDQAKKLLMLLSIISIIIACVGLYAVSFFSIIRRTKEIGIRKVNGACVSEILTMLNKDFVKWVAIAFIIATPVAYYAMHHWLENFAYKTSLSWWVFALAGLLALGIALLTVSWQSWKAATRNPVEALRYE